MVSFRLRDTEGRDREFLTEMLVEAADWRPSSRPDPLRRQRALAEEKVARYVADWPRSGDSGLIAEDAGRRPIGACWLRLFTAAEPAYGFVSAEVPELAIGVAGTWRGRGVGGSLLRGVIERAKTAGHGGVSLSVDLDNPAKRLYESAGFVVVEARASAVTMVLTLD